MPTPFQPASFLARPDEFGVVPSAAWKRGLQAAAGQLAWARYQHLVACEVNRKLSGDRPPDADGETVARNRWAAGSLARRLTAAAKANRGGSDPAEVEKIDTTALRKKLRGQTTCTLEDVLAWALELGTDVLVEVVGAQELLPPDRPYLRG